MHRGVEAVMRFVTVTKNLAMDPAIYSFGTFLSKTHKQGY